MLLKSVERDFKVLSHRLIDLLWDFIANKDLAHLWLAGQAASLCHFSPGHSEIRCSETTRPRKGGGGSQHSHIKESRLRMVHMSKKQKRGFPQRSTQGTCTRLPFDASHFENQLEFTVFQHQNKALGTPRTARTAICHTHDLPLST